MRSWTTLRTLHAEIAEAALQSHGLADFRSTWLSCLVAGLGIDSACILSSPDGRSFSTCAINAESQFFRRNVGEYMAEFDAHEISRLIAGRPILDTDAFSARRRDELRVYREYLVPHGARGYGMLGWAREGHMFFLAVANAPGGRCMDYDVLQPLEALFAVVALGEAFHVSKEAHATRASVVPQRLELGGITAAEERVASLAQRGLTNAEIAVLTGTQPRTVRNQLSAAYRKLGVSNRTELAFILSGIDSASARARRSTTKNVIEEFLGHQ